MSTEAIDYDAINPDDEEFRLSFSEVSDEQGYELLPAGMQHFRVTETSRVAVKNEESEYFGAPIIKITCTVASGEFEGKPVFESFVVDPRIEVSMKRLKAFLRAIGYKNVDDERFSFVISDFIGEEFDGEVAIKKARKNPNTGEEYDPQNTIKKFYPHTMSTDDMLS